MKNLILFLPLMMLLRLLGEKKIYMPCLIFFLIVRKESSNHLDDKSNQLALFVLPLLNLKWIDATFEIFLDINVVLLFDFAHQLLFHKFRERGDQISYHHPVYAHARPARPHAPHRDFGRPGIRPERPAPGRPHTPPQKNPGFHFTPSNRHPGNQTDRPGTARPQKPHANRPEAKPGRPNVSRPDRPDTQRRPRIDNRHSGKRQNRSAQQARRNEAKRL